MSEEKEVLFAQIEENFKQLKRLLPYVLAEMFCLGFVIGLVVGIVLGVVVL